MLEEFLPLDELTALLKSLDLYKRLIVSIYGVRVLDRVDVLRQVVPIRLLRSGSPGDPIGALLYRHAQHALEGELVPGLNEGH